ncbi:MAG TPA: SDR family oxidoreductase [Nannocystaceae bacterium]|nr:SDR family oxidoreductase [Nannocystaceae bacterium]
MARVVLVTGASSGLGQACARFLALRGDTVFGTSRSAREDDGGVAMLAMDVDDDASVERAIATIVARAGRIDAVVNNAGFGLAGALEDTTSDEARAQLETNVIGVLRVCRAVIPHMRHAGVGHIVNVSSLAGRVAMPYQGMYTASKFALTGLTTSLRHELAADGIRVALVEPGDFKTGFTAARRMSAGSKRSAVHHDALARTLAIVERDEASGADPTRFAQTIARLLDDPAPPLRTSCGHAGQRFGAWLHDRVPDPIAERVVRRLYAVARRR